MANLEIQIKQELGVLNWNFEEINKALDIELKKYENLVFTEETMSEAKKTRANLNSVSKAINDKKILVKKEFCEPYFTFEEQVKKVIEKIANVSKGIDVQVKAFEDKEKADKKATIEAYYNTRGVGLPYIKFEKIFDEKWLNKSCTEKSWKEQISGIVETIKTNVAIINNMTDKDTKLLGNLYLEDLSLNLALTRYESIKERERVLEQQNNQGVSKPIQNENNAPTLPSEELEGNSTVLNGDFEEKLTRAFKVVATKQKIIDLANFMNENGIKFEKLDI